MDVVLRTDLLTGEYRYIPPLQALDEICLCPGRHRARLRRAPRYQIEIVRMLCSGEKLTTRTHSYHWPNP